MPALVMQHLMAVLALSTQLLIFIYLYTAHRPRFLRYILYAWGCFIVFKATHLVPAWLPNVGDLTVLSRTVGMVGDGLLLAAGLAFRGTYQVRAWHLALFSGVAVLTALVPSNAAASTVGRGIYLLLHGGTLSAAGWAFWPRGITPQVPRGARLLAGSLMLWGLHRAWLGTIPTLPETGAALVVHAAFYLLYFLAVFGIIILVLDAARRQTAALKEFNERLVDGLGEGLQLVDGQRHIRHANRWMVQQGGAVPRQRCYEALTHDGQPCPGCPLPERHHIAAPVHLDVLGPAERRLRLTCTPVRQPDGETFLLELVADVTEQEHLRTRLGEAERLAAVGELAAGLAHEIRNPLSAIVNATTLLEAETLLTADERTSTLATMKQEARRLNGVLSDFLAFARPRTPRRIEGQVGETVAHVAALLRKEPSTAAGVQVEVRLDPTVPPLAFDPDQLSQVLWNIARNGVEAMAGSGRLDLEVRQQHHEVLIAVTDTGVGIPASELGQIFVPFYSRRDGGTGLGLAIARSIVVAHGGRIEVTSTPGQGSCFTIHLPLREETEHGDDSGR